MPGNTLTKSSKRLIKPQSLHKWSASHKVLLLYNVLNLSPSFKTFLPSGHNRRTRTQCDLVYGLYFIMVCQPFYSRREQGSKPFTCIPGPCPFCMDTPLQSFFNCKMLSIVVQLFLFHLLPTLLGLGNSRKYPYPTTDGFHVFTPPCLRKFQNALPPHALRIP